MTTQASQPTQYGMGTNVVTVPPESAPLPGQVPPGRENQIQMMPRPVAPTGCPPGLEYLIQLDQILVKKQWRFGDSVIKGYIKNSIGQQIYFATQENGSWPNSSVTHIVDNIQQEVIRVTTPVCKDCYHRCAHIITVAAPPGQTIGHVRNWDNKNRASFDILDANFVPILKIRGPWFLCQLIRCNWDLDFPLKTYAEHQKIGKIYKQFPGCLKECGDDDTDFNITFPIDLDVKVKATLLGVLFF